MNLTPSLNVGEWLHRHRTLPLLERQLLVCHRLNTQRAEIMTCPEQPLTATQQQDLDTDAARLTEGEPLAYIVGERAFWDCTLEVSPAVLIPRPETETLVEQALTRICPGDRILDLGTGSGAIAIALANTVEATIVAVDESEAALNIARSNAARLSTSIDFRLSDWYQNVSGTYQVIVANPPYVAEADPHLPALAHEPRSALVSGSEGLDDLRLIIDGAVKFLADDGWLLVEHGYNQAAEVEALFLGARFSSVTMIRDLGNQPRVTVGQWLEHTDE